MDATELKAKFSQFTKSIINLVDSMPDTLSSVTIAQNIIRSGTAPAARYKAACEAKSAKDFIRKLKVVLEDLDETIHWLDVIADAELLPADQTTPIHDEAVILAKIIVRSINTTRAHQKANKEEAKEEAEA